jgi:hypothetical protein
MLDTCERYHIYEISIQGIQLKDNFAETYNPIYNVIMATYQSKNNNTDQVYHTYIHPSTKSHPPPLPSKNSVTHTQPDQLQSDTTNLDIEACK